MRKIRVGLLIDNIVIPFWAYKMVENIVLSEYAEVVLVVKKKTAIFQKDLFLQGLKTHLNLSFIDYISNGRIRNINTSLMLLRIKI
jgi:hypothetical protein